MTSNDGGDDPVADDERLLRSVELRELILEVVQTYERPLSLPELVTALVGGSGSSDESNGTTDLNDVLGIRLHHVHLPKLEQYGAIEYDSAYRVVQPQGG